MKYKFILILFLIGCILKLIDTLTRLMHWPTCFSINLLSVLFILLSCVILIFKLLKENNSNSKLNQ